MRVGMIALGCAKNNVDAEGMLALLRGAGHEIVADPAAADALIVNTCGFIEAARKESLDAVLEMAAYKERNKKVRLIMTGCLSERYAGELAEALPEVDAFLGVGEYDGIVAAVEGATDGVKRDGQGYRFFYDDRVLTTPAHYAYLKVADGCDNRCAYCAIPSIRGGYISRPMEDIMKDAERLAVNGARELNLIAQDTTRYGMDLYGERRLEALLDRLEGLDGVRWLRLLYLYPEYTDTALIRRVAASAKVVNYMDIPIQHTQDAILARMNRRGGQDAIRRLYDASRDAGDFTLRTTVIVGFPGETDEQFEAMLRFLRERPFDRLGAFAYSKEEGTPAASMKQVPARVRRERLAAVMEQQAAISHRLLSARVGGMERVMIERMAEPGVYVGRTAHEAPEADGVVYVLTGDTSDNNTRNETALIPGSFHDIVIEGVQGHDLRARLIDMHGV